MKEINCVIYPVDIDGKKMAVCPHNYQIQNNDELKEAKRKIILTLTNIFKKDGKIFMDFNKNSFEIVKSHYDYEPIYFVHKSHKVDGHYYFSFKSLIYFLNNLTKNLED